MCYFKSRHILNNVNEKVLNKHCVEQFKINDDGSNYYISNSYYAATKQGVLPTSKITFGA